MKEQVSIPTSKVQRAASFVGAGVKVGGNYLKHYAKKAVNPSLSKSDLNESNANDIYATLSELKGSALKVAQMLSMDQNLLPKEYSKKFQMAQYSAPPLSYPLVVQTFKKQLGKNPSEIFDTFSNKAMHAASIGQVHQATLNGKKLAVKVQYPGVANSVKSDLKLVKPFAVRLLNLKGPELNKYFKEVEEKLLEETDYLLELKQSKEITEACKHIPGLVFPGYYEEQSSERIITMDWVDGTHLSEFIKTNPPQELRNQIGQYLWDFYDYQIHTLRKMHADPHPGNFLVTPNNQLAILDFGCVKHMPNDFYENYFALINPKSVQNEEQFNEILYKLEFLLPNDNPKHVPIFKEVFREMIMLLGKPFSYTEFDFGDNSYFEKIYAMGDQYSKMKEIQEANGARGSQHGLYVNRTYFGLYNILNQLGAKVTITTSMKS